jgi:hypothetical protein
VRLAGSAAGARGADAPRPPSEGPPAEFAEGGIGGSALRARAAEDAPTRIQPMIERAAEGPQRALFEAIRAEFEAATSFEDLDERLLALSARMPVEPLAMALGQAMALAALAGQAEVQEEADAALAGRPEGPQGA